MMTSMNKKMAAVVLARHCCSVSERLFLLV